jgi:hypothetical protein
MSIDLVDFLGSLEVDDIEDYISTIEGMISWIDGELKLGCEDEENEDRLTYDKANLKAVVCLLSDLVIGLKQD